MPDDLFKDQPGLQSVQSKVLLIVLQLGGRRWQTGFVILVIDFEVVGQGF